jgi:hypothetical protein
MKYKSDEYGSASKEIIWLKPDEKEAAVIFHTVGGDYGPSAKPNPRAATFCAACRGIRTIHLGVSPFGAENYINTRGKEVECLTAECAACGNGWPVYAVGKWLHIKPPKRK